ncbi:MAG TPA: site-specific integrase [Blastocatellia bacterium]
MAGKQIKKQKAKPPHERNPQKRGKHEGSIYQRSKDRRWCASVVFPDGTRKVAYRATRAEAATALAELIDDVRKRNPPKDERITLETYLQDWLGIVKHRLRPKSYRFYEQLIRNHISGSALARRRLAHINSQDIQAWLLDHCEKIQKPRTCEAIFQVLRSSLNDAVTSEIIPKNPVLNIAKKRPKYSAEESEPFPIETLARFLETAKTHPLGLLFQLAATTGLRQGELMALCWEDVDLAARTIQVRATLQEIDRQTVRSQPKSKQSKRILPIPDSLADAFRAHRRQQKELRMQVGSEWPQHPDFVFRTAKKGFVGRPLDARNLTRAYHALQRKSHKDAGLKGDALKKAPIFSFHSLRHTTATLMAILDTNPKVASTILGHSSVSLTLDIYSHIQTETKRPAIDAVDRLIRQK